MKRLLALITLVTVCIHANGATINWGMDKSYFETSSLGKNATGYLIYLGDSGEDWTTTTVDYMAIAEGTSENYLSTKATSVGKLAGQVSATEGVTPVYPGAQKTITDGTSVFGIMLTYVNSADGETYYHLGGVYTFDTSDTGTYTAANKAFTWTDAAIPSGSSSSSQGWKTVPEPSVALMGLLGLGMLLKRRRA